MFRITSKDILARFFQRDPVLFVYALADLDERLFKSCLFYGNSGDEENLRVVLFVYCGMKVPCILAHAPDEAELARSMLSAICQKHPGEIFGLIQEDLSPVIGVTHEVYRSCQEQRMFLANRNFLSGKERAPSIVPLTPKHVGLITELVALSNAESWFSEESLLYRQTWGVFDRGTLVAMTGTHAFSEQFGVAAIGNVVTHPEFRGRGFATALVSHQCLAFPETITTIGLNVRTTNLSAIQVYQKIGFRVHSRFLEVFAR